MSDSVISVEGLGKVYRLGAIGSTTLREDFSRAWAHVRGRPDPALHIGQPHHERKDGKIFWALRDVSFDVTRGEVFGIIGRNGAGKSTLLKIISRITAPTTGVMRVSGSVASLLEVGTGFHPDLTGRENVMLNGVILGMSRREIRAKFDEIVDFSGVEDFIDTPVKRYSSGMYVRLAFAVAAHLDSEILILDEVLSVGDAAFQRKCLGKMGGVAKEGRTILFVSHNMIAVQSLCSRAILLVDGEIAAAGRVGDVVPRYLGASLADTSASSSRSWPDVSSAPGTDTAKLTRIHVAPATDSPGGLITMQTPVAVEVDYCRLRADAAFHVTLHLVNEQEVIVLTTSPGTCHAVPGVYRSRCLIPGDLLNSGVYRLKPIIIEDGTRGTLLDDAIATFSVEDLRPRAVGWMQREPSVLQVPLPWQTEAVGRTTAQAD